MKTLYITEKPSLAEVIANHIWPQKNVLKGPHCYDGGNIIVTWSFGHILATAEPEQYDEKYKSWGEFPIYPEEWKLFPLANTKEHFKKISQLIKEADEIVHVGDPDREGQLLIDEILTYCGNKKPVKRLLLLGLDDVNVKHAFENMQDNKKFHNLYLAGLARQRADWLIGMNLSRAYGFYARKYGYASTQKIGRVKMPTLALVVRRENEIENFMPKDFFELIAVFEKDGIKFKGKLKPEEDFSVDPENRILVRDPLDTIAFAIKNEKAKVLSVETKDKTERPPLPHSLDTLQIEANKKYGYSPDEVLAAVQSMYEAKFVTYPRSDCNYIPEAQFADAGAILDCLKAQGFSPAQNANRKLKSAAWNDKKVTAHTAIIPTTAKPEKLTEKQQNIYEMIALNFCLQFYEPCKSKTTNFEIAIDNHIFTGTGNTIISPGFKEIVKSSSKKKEEINNDPLPSLAKGDITNTVNATVSAKETTPPERFTEGTLLKAMANIYKYMDPKNPNREKLKEVKGIGTPATRSNIISELIHGSSKDKNAKTYLRVVKGKLQPTEFGRFTIENIDESLTLPDTTAIMEYNLSEIADGKKTLNDYIVDVQRMIEQNISYASKHEFPINVNAPLCPVCKKHPLKEIRIKGSKYKWFVCSSMDCKSPDTGRPLYFVGDKKTGQPLIYYCPDCGSPLHFGDGQYGPYWKCDHCNKPFNIVNGVVKEKEKKMSKETEVLCPICKKSHLKEIPLKSGGVAFLCVDKDCVSPVTEKPIWYTADKDRKPLVVLCPDCGYPIRFGKGQYGNYAICDKCKTYFDYDKTYAGTATKKEAKKAELSGVICPICGKHELERITMKSGIRYRCSDKNCKKPNSEYAAYFPEKDGKPNIQKCLKCESVLDFIHSAKTGKDFWKCNNCGEFYNDKNGVPVKQEYHAKEK